MKTDNFLFSKPGTNLTIMYSILFIAMILLSGIIYHGILIVLYQFIDVVGMWHWILFGISLLISYAIVSSLKTSWHVNIKIQHKALILLFGERTDILISEGDWIIPFYGTLLKVNIINFQIQNKEYSNEINIESKEGVTAIIPGFSIEYQVNEDNFKNYLNITEADLEKNLSSNISTFIAKYLNGMEAKKIKMNQDFTEKSLTKADREIYGLTNPDNKSPIEEMIAAYGIKIHGVRINRVKYSDEYNRAGDKLAIEEYEQKAETIEMDHVGNMIDSLAKKYIANGMKPKEANELATATYQNQIGKDAKIIHITGKGGGIINS